MLIQSNPRHTSSTVALRNPSTAMIANKKVAVKQLDSILAMIKRPI